LKNKKLKYGFRPPPILANLCYLLVPTTLYSLNCSVDMSTENGNKKLKAAFVFGLNFTNFAT
jgi:hypothetical protein